MYIGIHWIGSKLISEEGVVPVSYTHLDVYKRQIIASFQSYLKNYRASQIDNN